MSEPIGASYLGEGRVRFRTWAPRADKVEAVLGDGRTALLEPASRGYHEALLDDVGPGTTYRFLLDGGPERADPASRHQPAGVHGPSAVSDPAFDWTDAGWTGIPLERYVVYEVHVGTLTSEGTFDAAIGLLDDLIDLGVTALELMPIAQFPGARNWGYDGAFPFAVQDTYGGPAGFKRLVDACHARGLAVVLDVVYNHLGPEGAHADDFGSYYTDRFVTPWGRALNFDDADSDEVRAFFIANALMWFEEFHVDALRLDAVHAIMDLSPRPFLRELAEAVQARRDGTRPRYLIAESDLNDPRTVSGSDEGGYGLDAVWADDFHHAIHAQLTGERDGYYMDYGEVADVAGALERGFLYDGRYSPYRRRTHGAPARGIPKHRFVVCVQNHDQVGNRMLGERLTALVDFESLKLAAGLNLLSPFTPLLFMGEEYGEAAPFQYFVDHSEPELIEAVRAGRKEEFAAFGWEEEPPDPQDPATFLRSKLDRSHASTGRGRQLRDLYRELLRARAEIEALTREGMTVEHSSHTISLSRRGPARETLSIFNVDFGAVSSTETTGPPWRCLIDSADERWGGPGRGVPELAGASITVRPRSFVLLERERA